MGREPFAGPANTAISGLRANGEQGQDSIGGGGAIAAELPAIVPRLIGVVLGGGEMKAAIGVLAAFDINARLVQGRIGRGRTGRP